MKIVVIGSGMMGQAIVFDLNRFSNFKKITLIDKDKKTLDYAKKILNDKKIDFRLIDIKNSNEIKDFLRDYDVAISAVPYIFNLELTKIAIDTKTHFLDLGGNNDIVNKQRQLFQHAKENGVTIIPDCGLAPGLASVIVKDLFEQYDYIDSLRMRVGGLPINPKPPLSYQIVFSPYGLINEYVEDAIVVENGKIITKKSMTELEKIKFPKPFEEMEAFLTSGGCSTIPYTYRGKINQLDYKTVRYPGQCEKFKILLDIGLADDKEIDVSNNRINSKDFFASILFENLPKNELDVVLLKVTGEVFKDGKNVFVEYIMVDRYDEKNNITSMMRTTGYPVSIIAQMIGDGKILKRGVFCSEEIVPCQTFFDELKKRDILIKKKITYE